MDNQNKQKKGSSKPSPDQNNYLKFTGIAFELTAYNVICVWGGHKLDQLYSPKSHWIIILAAILAAVGTIYYLFKRVNTDS